MVIGRDGQIIFAFLYRKKTRKTEAVLFATKNLQSKKQRVTTGIVKKAMISQSRKYQISRLLSVLVTIG